MGEVGTEIEPTAQIKINGELNGNHVEQDPEEMEVDSVEDLKKTIKDNENEPKVLPSSNSNNTNGNKQENKNDSKEVMDVDDNESMNGDDVVPSQPEEVTIPDRADNNSEDGTMDSEKDVLALPEDQNSNNNKITNNHQSDDAAVILSDSSDESDSEEDNSSATSKFQSAERSAAVSESEGISNGATSTNQSRMEFDDDDDKPVSIHSDSDEKDDCIMIDDESKKGSAATSEKSSPRRPRKNNLQSVTDEVKMMMDPNADPYAAPAEPQGEPETFGAKDVFDLNRVQLLNAYTCTECGRCTSECPANLTGKKLSPRKIMMDTRDRLEEVSKNIDANGSFVDDGKIILSNKFDIVNILYKGIVVDEEGLPLITEREIDAIAVFCAYTDMFKRALVTKDSASMQLAQILEQK